MGVANYIPDFRECKFQEISIPNFREREWEQKIPFLTFRTGMGPGNIGLPFNGSPIFPGLAGNSRSPLDDGVW